MGMYLISLSTNTSGASIVSDIVNCTKGFEIAVTYGVPQAPLDGPGGAISFWPGAYVGAANNYCWLFQPLLMQGETTNGWSAAPAAWIQEPSGPTAAQLGWADSTVKQGNLFVPKPGDRVKSYISYDKATGNWIQGMQDMTSGQSFACQFTAGQTYRNVYPCPDNSKFYIIYFTIECAFPPTAANIWRGEIDALATFTVDSRTHKQDFTNTANWTPEVYSGVGGLRLEEPDLDRFKMVLPPVPAE